MHAGLLYTYCKANIVFNLSLNVCITELENTRCKCLHKGELKSFTIRKECDRLLFILGYTYIKMTLLLNEIASATNSDMKMDTLITCFEKKSCFINDIHQNQDFFLLRGSGGKHTICKGFFYLLALELHILKKASIKTV